MLVFPNIKPDKITQIDLPEYTNSVKEFKQGDKLFKRTQFVGAGLSLQLSFSFLSQSELDSILVLWDNSEGSRLFTLPIDFYSSYPIEIKAAIQSLKSSTFWRIQSPPSYTPRILSAYDGVVDLGRTNRYDIELTITSEIA
jgi:hypothetical protein